MTHGMKQLDVGSTSTWKKITLDTVVYFVVCFYSSIV